MSDQHPMDDAQHAARITNPRSAEGSVDEIDGESTSPLVQREANSRTPEAIDGSTALSPDRSLFLRTMEQRGGFRSVADASKWANGVFDAMRHHAVEHNHGDAVVDELHSVVKVGEAPETQIEEMMWGGNFVQRMADLASYLSTWNRDEFYTKVAQEAGSKPGDPQVEQAVNGFFGALKEQLGPDGERAVPNLGELQQVWEQA